MCLVQGVSAASAPPPIATCNDFSRKVGNENFYEKIS